MARRGGVLVCFAVLGLSGVAGAEAPTDPEMIARAGNCPAALPVFAARRAADPAGPGSMLEIQCLIRLRRYTEAEPLLRDHIARDAAPGEAWLYLGMVRFHLGDTPGAAEALDRAGPELAGRSEHRLYHGLVLLSRGEALAAASELELAREGSAAPVAGYWAGVAWLRAGERSRGREALRRVMQEAPDSPWSLQAARALESGTADAQSGPRWWARATAGYEYDDNVVLRAGDVPLAREVSSQRDTRFLWRTEAGREWWRDGDWSSGTWLSYTGTDHDELSSLDVHLPTVGLWLDRRLGEAMLLRLTYDYGYAFVDEASFLQSHGLTPSVVRSFGRLGTTQLFARGYAYDYRGDDADVPDGSGDALARCPSLSAIVCGARGVDESDARDRDGFGVAAGLLHSVPVEKLRTQISLGYTYYRYWAEGKEQAYAGHEVRLVTRTALPFQLQLRIDASYAYRPYRHASSVPEPFELFLNREYPTREYRRRDQVARVEVGLERPITDRARIGVLYSYLDNDSNYGLFAYDRQIVGTYVTVGFGPGRWER